MFRSYTKTQEETMSPSKLSEDWNMEDNRHVMVAAIDFGTTFSGYAYSFKTDKNAIFMNKNWGEEGGYQSFKAPTSVLVDREGKLLEFGFTAEKRYKNNDTSYELYRHFKMALHKQEHLTRSTEILSVRGTPANAMNIFVQAVKFLQAHLFEALTKRGTKSPDNDMIRWVITVPAIWSEKSKRFMREVAYKAGLIKRMDSRQFMVCLEPEAASIYCRQLEIDQFSKDDESGTKLLKKTGTKYMIVDAGGGTVDITVHEILSDGRVKELTCASGGEWGGTRVDTHFIDLLKRTLGETFVERCQKEYPSEWLDMTLIFEQGKKGVKPNDEVGFRIPLNYAFGEKYKTITNKKLENAFKDTKRKGVKFASGTIVLDPDATAGLFSPVITQIVSHIRGQMEGVQGVGLILLVGGFGECAFLREAIEAAFSPGVSVLCPAESGIAVVKGAVLFGHSPEVVQSRISRKTYGEEILRSLNESKDPESQREQHDGIYLCRTFNKYVKKGESVDVGEVRSFTSSPLKANQTNAHVTLFSSDAEDIDYMDNPEVKELGSLVLQMPDITGGKSREIVVEVYFGSTEILVEAQEIKKDGTGHKVETRLDFLSN